MNFDFEDLTPVGYPGVSVTGWAEISVGRGDWYIHKVFIGDYDSKTDWAVLVFPDPLTTAVLLTLSGGVWEQHISNQLAERAL